MIKLLIKLIKLVFILLVLVTISAFAYQKGWLKQHPLAAQINTLKSTEINNFSDLKNIFSQKTTDGNELKSNFGFDQESLGELSHNAGEQIKLMSEKAVEAGQVAKDFVDGSIQVDEGEDKKLSERAFEYGQYIYCKAVVDDWNEQHSSSSATF